MKELPADALVQELGLLFEGLGQKKLERIYKLLRRIFNAKKKRVRQPKYGSMNKGFTEEELHQFFAAVTNEKHRLAFSMQAYLGLRIGEVVQAKLSDLDFDKNWLRVDTEKGHKVDYLPLNERIKPLLSDWVRKTGNSIQAFEGYLFFPNEGYRHGSRKEPFLNSNHLRNTFRDACERAGLNEVYAESDDLKNPVRSKRGKRRLPLNPGVFTRRNDEFHMFFR